MSDGGSTRTSGDDASVGDAVSLASTLRDGIASHALTPEQFAVVAEVIDGGVAALQRMATHPHQTGEITDHIAGTLRSLEGIQHIPRHGPDGVAGIDAMARAAVADFVTAFGGNASALDAVPGPIVDARPANRTTPVTPHRTEVGDAYAEPLENIVEAYCTMLAGRVEPMTEKDIDATRTKLLGFVEYVRDRVANGTYRTNGSDRSQSEANAATAPLQVTIADCTAGLLREYERALAHLPERFAIRKATRGMTFPQAIEHGRKHPELRKISEATIRNGHIAFVRSSVQNHCDDHDIANPFSSVRLHKRKTGGKRYKPLRIPIVNKAIELGAAEGIVPAVLPLLALLTSRRLAMLVHLNADWLSRVDGHWVCHPTDYVEIDGRTHRARAKTDHSLLPFVIHDQLVAMGMVGSEACRR